VEVHARADLAVVTVVINFTRRLGVETAADALCIMHRTCFSFPIVLQSVELII
jgi:hypothetical protein